MADKNVQRLDKFLANSGVGTRSEVKNFIKCKKVKVNDMVVKSADTKINILEDKIFVDNREIIFTEFEYYMLNKPAGVVSATNDNTCKTVLDLIEGNTKKDLFPVGRLDKDTEGLLIITNDGPLAHALLSPKKHVDKTYYVETDGKITGDMTEAFKNGVDIGDEKPTMPAKLIINSRDNVNSALLTIKEGRFHQVKRMFQAMGLKVIFLKRISMGPLSLDESLKTGEYRKLTEKEIEMLKK